VADYSINFNWESTAPKTETLNFYDDGEKRASDVVDEIAKGIGEAFNYALARTVSHRSIDAGVTYDKSKVETFFLGEKGDEVADYSINFNWESTAEKTQTINFYDDGLKRAADVVEEISQGVGEAFNYALARTVSHRSIDAGVTYNKSKVETFFLGEQSPSIDGARGMVSSRSFGCPWPGVLHWNRI
ncbi:MAG: hypothetical protein ACE10B_07980, partial [Phycisphaerales bacterium]